MNTLKASCGCEIHVAQWTSKRKIGSVKQCSLHKHAGDLLSALREISAGNLDNEGFVEFHNRARQVALRAIAKAEG